MRMEKLPYERIRNLRCDADLSQKQIAEYLHISQNTYSQYEIGTLRFPLDIVVRLAELFDTSVDYLVELTDDPRPYPQKKRK